ncbi:MAG TPA: M56 family metallopeptidase [Streptosporangiaceae bacterium]|nr:M56 family metallopeptidase [Streptosporangiaceae bacterium]
MSLSVLLLAAVAIGCVVAARLLVDAQWPRRSPAVAIALWQAIGLGWGVATVGALAGFGTSGLTSAGSARLASTRAHLDRMRLLWAPSPHGGRPAPRLPGTATAGRHVASVASPAQHLSSVATSAARVTRQLLGTGGTIIHPWTVRTGLQLLSLAASAVLFGVLCWILIAAISAVLRARHRQRALLGLLAHRDPKVPGALVVDHPAAAAYCVPGLRSAIVISAGTLDLLDQAELAAVLAHERAHLRARHDLVLLPFTALLRAFRWSAVARDANSAVALLVEMLADDRARRLRPAKELATALLRVGASGGGQVPAGALAAAGTVSGELAARVSRLLRPPPGLAAPAVVAVATAAALLVVAPAIAVLLPL